MLARYKIYRGKRLPDDPLPEGVRQDTRWRTRHCLRPPQESVEKYLEHPGDDAWDEFWRDYLNVVESRYQSDKAPFDELADQAQESDLFLGCSCPTQKNPDVYRCHTVLALEFMKSKYPFLKTEMP